MRLFTVPEIAKRYNVAPITARKWCERGFFHNAKKIGRDWIIPESDLLKFKKAKVGYPKGKPRKPNTRAPN